MIKKSLYLGSFISLIAVQSIFAFDVTQNPETSRYFNGPAIFTVSENSATVSLSPTVVAGMSDFEKSIGYFEYNETHLMCIAIYPTPQACLPKKTEIGKTTAVLTNLKPNTSYSISYKRDNTIRCITTPCPRPADG